MKYLTIIILAVLVSLLVFSCGKTKDEAELPAVITHEEAEKEAEKLITEENLEEEADKLMKEIQSELD